MKKRILSYFILILCSTTLSAQVCYKTLKDDSGVKVKYKWKQNKENQPELWVKFKTTEGSNLNVDLQLGFFLNGVQNEKADINDCLKKFFWNDWFRPIHIVSFTEIKNEDIQSDQFAIEILSLNAEKVDKCEEIHD